MTQYLIRTLTDSTGRPFTHVTKARENETFTVVEAESKEEAEKMAKKPKYIKLDFSRETCPMCNSGKVEKDWVMKYCYIFTCFDCGLSKAVVDKKAGE
ncbi:DUF1381 domain-containing protein [Staphylococcus gallinarum]|jgi:hypothetical protein|uniref:DUF1381 domain-containing protein n=1 Tax=Staphylococcus gallinarum TaxID=1293 RepID=UPI000D1CE5A3|nr:DUF1381 domain-containing protein [Staphylococcus gallinarum]PTE36167.1 hypothetical protein BUZ00_05965 [Staphylococcus gallinarum]